MSPEDLLREIGQRLNDPTHTEHERRVCARHFATSLEFFDETLAEYRSAPREPGKDEL